jgi:hypothetical protein
VAGDFNGDGRTDLVAGINNFSSITQTFLNSAVGVLIGNGDGTFQKAFQFTLNQFDPQPGSVVAGDFNGDGRLDLVTNSAMLVGNGDGTFQPLRPYAGGGAGLQGDFNGDGKLDILVGSADHVSLLKGNGDGTFQPPVQFPVGSSATSLISGDFNGDGRPDLAAGGSVLLNLAGTFVPPGSADTIPHATPLVADVNGDGTDDVLVIDPRGAILLRQGRPQQPGSFDPPVTINPVDPQSGAVEYPSRDLAWVPHSAQGPLLASVDATDDAVSLFAWREGHFSRIGALATGLLPAQVVSADLDTDGANDLVVRNAGDGTLSLFFNHGPGTGSDPFGLAVTLAVGPGISDFSVADVDQDGIPDLLLTNKLSGEAGLMRGLGGGSFAPPSWYRAGTGLYAVSGTGDAAAVTSLEAPAGIVDGRFSPGGLPGLVTIDPGSESIGLLAGLGQGRFANPVALPTQGPARAVRGADFNADGLLDLVVLTADGLSVSLSDGRGGFAPPVTYDAGPDPTGLTIADVNHDGNLDLLVGNPYGDLLVLLGTGDGRFQPYHEVDQAVTLAVADLTGHGTRDIIYADQGLDRVVVEYGDKGTAVLGDRSQGLLSPGAVTLADMNGDGIPDLVVANSGSNNVLIYPGTGDGQFGPALNGGHGFFTGTNPVALAVADVSGDALPDLVVANAGSNDVSVLLGQGRGASWTLVPGPRIKTHAGPDALAVGNILNDSHPDLAVANRQANDVQVFPGVGGGFFDDQAPTTYPVGQAPSGLFLGHFNGAGTGIATLNAGSNTITVIGPTGAEQTLAAGGLHPTTGFAGDFLGNGFTDLVVGNSGDGHLALLLGGAGGLSLSQTLISDQAPEPTGLSFAGVSDGVLSFYASTAGREAAIALAFDLSGGPGPEGSPPPVAGPPGEATTPSGVLVQEPGGAVEPSGVGPPVDVDSGLGSSLAGVLAQAAGGSVQQVAQLLSLSGSALDLAATLLTVSAVPGDSEGDFSAGTVAMVGSTGLGQGPGAAHREEGSGGSDVEREEGEGPSAAEALPTWERLSIGLERAWERARAAILGIESEPTVAGGRQPSNPAEASPRATRPVPPPTRPGTDARSRPASRPDAEAVGPIAPVGPTSDRGPQDASRGHDAALEELVAEREEEARTARWGLAWLDELTQVHRLDAIIALAAVTAMASAAGAAWRLRASRVRRRTPMPPPTRHPEDRRVPIT